MMQWLKSMAQLFLLLAIVWAGGLAWFTTLIPFSEEPQNPPAADAIVVLTGGSLRMERGFELLAAGKAPRMLISGVEDGLTLDALLRKKEFIGFAGHIPPAAVELGHLARTTIGNAEETAQWVAHEHVKSILLVTGNYHMPRSSYELREAMPDLVITPVPVFPSHFAHNEWWQYADSIRLVISEYHKYITSRVVYTLLVKS